MEISQLSLTILVVILFVLLALFMFLKCFRMPQNFQERQQMRSEVRKKLGVIKNDMQRFAQKNTSEDSKEDGQVS